MWSESATKFPPPAAICQVGVFHVLALPISLTVTFLLSLSFLLLAGSGTSPKAVAFSALARGKRTLRPTLSCTTLLQGPLQPWTP